MTIDVSPALALLAQPVSVETRAADTYDGNGNRVPGAPIVVSISATVQPASGRQLMDMPEGIRDEARWLIWSAFAFETDHRVQLNGQTYKVLHVWRRQYGGFTRAALGLLA